MSTLEPLSPEERRQMKARLTEAAEYPGPLPVHPPVRLALENGLWLLEQNDALTRERDAALSRLSRAREALDRYDEEPPHYRAGLDEENAWRARQEAALTALRAALSEPPAG